MTVDQTGGEVGGALGVAALAPLLGGQSESGPGVGPFPHVYPFCTLATVAVAVAALWLIPKEKR